jgi:hypothetical protein
MTTHTSSFAELISAAQRDIGQADFDAIRAAYPHHPGYQPAAQPPDYRSIQAAFEKRDWQGAWVQCAALLEVEPLQIQLHQLMAHLYRELAQPDRAQWHFTFAAGLMRSILDSGDGRTFASAYVVVTLAEEYDVLRALRMAPRRQQLIISKGHPYDVWECGYPTSDGEQTDTRYFDVSALLPRAE